MSHREVQLQQADGANFILKPETVKESRLDVAGIDLNISTQEIIDIVREGRGRQAPL